MHLSGICTSFVILLSSIATTPFVSAFPTLNLEARAPPSASVVHIVHEFPKGTWVENLAVRKNGQILATLLNKPQVYQVDPSTGNPILLHTFSSSTSCFGIAELDPDVFYVVVGNYSLTTFTPTPASFAVWKLDLTAFLPTYNVAQAKVSKVSDLPRLVGPNGMGVISKIAKLLIIADSASGTAYSLNVNSKAVKLIQNDPLMKPTGFPPNAPNGIHSLNGFTYFTNTNTQIFGKIPINAQGSPAGLATTVASNAPGDDFTLDNKGNAFIALGSQNELGYVPAAGGSVAVLVGSTSDTKTLAGPTAVQFDRRSIDQSSVYISTNGGIERYITGNFTIGGTVTRVDFASSNGS
ncbi:MAG: hypothetical protein LQ351_004576 [Letrouitia transgressa]|nr:MAG: hypothetical protein LQ351_004576 [Letrouitia transgressa]